MDNSAKKTDEKSFIKVPIYNCYFDTKKDSIYPSENNSGNLKNLFSSKTEGSKWRKLSIDSEEFNIHLLSFKNPTKNTVDTRKKRDEEKLVYEVEQKADNTYYIKTGRYIGVINTKAPVHSTPANNIKIEINTKYGELLLNRMLNFASDVRFDSHSRLEHVKDTNSDDYFSYILGYLFLIHLQQALAKGLPTCYQKITEHGLNVKGRIEINDYISRDMMYGYKVTYSYNRLDYVQDIVDVLYSAMSTLVSSGSVAQLMNEGDYSKYYSYLKQLYSGNRPSRMTIKSITSNKALRNPMHSDYRIALVFAQYILEHKNIINDDGNAKGNAYLIDANELWELYLYGLIKRKYENKNYGYKVTWQYDYPIYSDAFWGRTNYPDIVMESNDSIVVFDAKFKTMDFNGGDVDRPDIHQLHSYAGYFMLNEKFKDKKLKLCSLVYPTRSSSGDKNCVSTLYGLPGKDLPKFAISYLEIPHSNNLQLLLEKENDFLSRVNELLAE